MNDSELLAALIEKIKEEKEIAAGKMYKDDTDSYRGQFKLARNLLQFIKGQRELGGEEHEQGESDQCDERAERAETL
ncbi:hypothetical protein GZH47_32900 (plasmid) [Paenibacillus rhizovicinus]|uniref:Uncharacterized protein n=1 Tax=Paenibacillus rhizovicinus TaxID=2704463 RepID=A0A6C0PCI9_9BACL|nr:hypothetical protein [Paenibacillus rhizovicinus]QHW35693.1 hypothetical protein GZH47_32900 [Paenibacillus rhizovicinus]